MSLTVEFALLSDDALRIHAATTLRDQLSAWLPLAAAPAPVTGRGIVNLHIGPIGSLGLRVPAALPAPTLTIGSHAAHINGDVAWIIGDGFRGRADLEAGQAFVEIAPDETELVPVLSLVAALMLARVQRYLLHCAAVRAPDGTVWLLAGDARAGKTSTALGLARVGWDLLSDDHVVIFRNNDGWQVDGWPRVLHPDAGWRDGVITGRRAVLDPRDVDITLQKTGTLGAVLLPRIARGEDSSDISSASVSDALSMLLRQSAWSLADRTIAADVLRDLAEVAALPAFHLALAPDSFRAPERLLDLLTPGVST